MAMKEKAKSLDIVFDTKLHWNDHIEYLITRCKKCVNLIRRLSGTRWGADREILIGIYRSLIESHYYTQAQYTAPCVSVRLNG
nr:unnamed protein product [Callosobruchus analis]